MPIKTYIITITKAATKNLDQVAAGLADVLPNSTKVPGKPAVRLLSTGYRDLKAALNQLEQFEVKRYKIQLPEEDIRMGLLIIWVLSIAVTSLLRYAFDYGGLIDLALSVVSGTSLSIYWLWANDQWDIELFP